MEAVGIQASGFWILTTLFRLKSLFLDYDFVYKVWSMKRLCLFLGLFACLVFLGCADFFNRTYHYREEIPLKPFVVKLLRTDYSLKQGQLILKVTLNIANRSSEKNSFSRNRFVLRVGATQEVQRDPTLLEMLGADNVFFVPGEEAALTVAFVVPQDSLNQSLALIVDRQQKRGREQLTLIRLKNRPGPKNLPAEGEWRSVHSAGWN